MGYATQRNAENKRDKTAADGITAVLSLSATRTLACDMPQSAY